MNVVRGTATARSSSCVSAVCLSIPVIGTRPLCRRLGIDIYYYPALSAVFGSGHGDGFDFSICHYADAEAYSWTEAGKAFAESASTGVHPFGQGFFGDWLAAEVVAWAV